MQKNNNKGCFIGTFDETIFFEYTISGENFFRIYLKISRKKGNTIDTIPVIVSEHLVNLSDYKGRKVKVKAEFRSFHLDLFLFATDIKVVKENATDKNSIILNGTIGGKKVIYKNILLKEIKVSYIVLVVRTGIRIDYIPCIAWGRDARSCKKFPFGQYLQIKGFISSKGKHYKVSICKLETK